MTVHDDMMEQAIEPLLNIHGETVTLTPHNDLPKEITALVRRHRLQAGGNAEAGRHQARELVFRRSDHPDLVLNGDTVDLKKRVDDSDDTTMELTRLLDQTDTIWRVEVS